MASGLGFDDGVGLRAVDRLAAVGDGLGDGIAVVGKSDGSGDGSTVTPLASTLGAAAAPEPGTLGRIAATVDDPACSEVVNVTTVAAATVVITAAAANLYSLVGGTVGLPWTRMARQRHPP